MAMQPRFQRIDLVQPGCLNGGAPAMRAVDADSRAARAAREAVCEYLLHITRTSSRRSSDTSCSRP
jgi:hypothetical protein